MNIEEQLKEALSPKEIIVDDHIIKLIWYKESEYPGWQDSTSLIVNCRSISDYICVASLNEKGRLIFDLPFKTVEELIDFSKKCIKGLKKPSKSKPSLFKYLASFDNPNIPLTDWYPLMESKIQEYHEVWGYDKATDYMDVSRILDIYKKLKYG